MNFPYGSQLLFDSSMSVLPSSPSVTEREELAAAVIQRSWKRYLMWKEHFCVCGIATAVRHGLCRNGWEMINSDHLWTSQCEDGPEACSYFGLGVCGTDHCNSLCGQGPCFVKASVYNEETETVTHFCGLASPEDGKAPATIYERKNPRDFSPWDRTPARLTVDELNTIAAEGNRTREDVDGGVVIKDHDLKVEWFFWAFSSDSEYNTRYDVGYW